MSGADGVVPVGDVDRCYRHVPGPLSTSLL